jgi:hypothetical protein
MARPIDPVRVIGNAPAWADPDSPMTAWCLEWTDALGIPQRLLYGYGPAARQLAQAHADRLAGDVAGRCANYRNQRGRARGSTLNHHRGQDP